MRWLEASIRVPTADAERVGGLLVEAGSQGVITGVRELARGPRARRHETVRGFFPGEEPVRARLAVRAALSRAGVPALARAHVGWRELDERLWEIDWREHFQPVAVGRSLLVVPPWNRDAVPGRRRVVIHPGMAFGTGQHETTRACLEALERLVSVPVARALDVGTGTGVLAIALAKLGVRRVLAVDVDPQAVAAARANVRRNGVGARVRVSARPIDPTIDRGGAGASGAAPWADGLAAGATGSGRARSGERQQHGTQATDRAHHDAARHRSASRLGRYPLVVANLYVDALVGLEPTFAAVVAPGGHLVTSGVLRAQQGRLRAAFAKPRWAVREARRSGTWVTTVLVRGPLPPAASSRPRRSGLALRGRAGSVR